MKTRKTVAALVALAGLVLADAAAAQIAVSANDNKVERFDG